MPFNPLFLGTSSEIPELITVSLEDEPTGNLVGVQLKSHDKGLTNDMFTPGYVSILKLLEGKTVAWKNGLLAGDYIVAVNGVGYRRFQPDYNSSNARKSYLGFNTNYPVPFDEVDDENDAKIKLKNRVISGKNDGEAYKEFLVEVKKVRDNGSEPLLLLLERFCWDARANSWGRFKKSRKGNVVEAMKMLQEHEFWRDGNFPIDLTKLSLQRLLKSNAFCYPFLVSCVTKPQVLCVKFSIIQSLNCCTNDLSNAVILYMETLLSKCINPQCPEISFFIDVSNVFYNRIRPDILRKLYSIFEPNYPETLHKMVIYPVTKYLVSTASALLSFVNETTKLKFIITDDLAVVCKELGWNEEEIECCGGVPQFMQKYEKRIDKSFIFDY